MRGTRTGAGTRQGRFSLIEILVAVLIVSVGILGVASLQLVSLRNNTSALLRTQAFDAAYDIMDRARANPAMDYSIDVDDDAPAANNCENAACTPAQMRDYDQMTWLNNLAADLPNGDGQVAIAGNVMTVMIRWQDDRDPGAAALDLTVESAL